ncbi:vWA domain-containing protein [Lysobacter humi (ex Lee et al. 2017)]
MIDTGALGFLRPAWFVALALLPLAWLWWCRRVPARRWEGIVDAHLLPHLLERGAGRRTPAAPLAALAFVFAVVALAGPTWRSADQPLWQTRSPLVIAVDLSSATLAADLPPTRLAQLRARLGTFVREHRSGPVALVAFAGDAFTVAPVTDDVANVGLFVDALHPDVMPVDGQAVDRAIAWSRQLIERAGFGRGHVLVVTDHADGAALRAAAASRDAGVAVSVLGLGTPAGAEVRTLEGRIARVRLDEASLRELASRGGGRYARIAIDGRDSAVFAQGNDATLGASRGDRIGIDEGFRLVPVVMLLAAAAWLLRAPGVAVLVLVLAWPRPVPAADLWRRPDQQAHAAMREGVEAYRRGDFRRAAEAFARADTAEAHYDRGNALARSGALEDAVAAYDEALRRRPGMADAVANRAAVLQALKRRQPGRGGPGRPSSSGGANAQPQVCPPGDPRCTGREASPQRAQAPATRGPGQGTPTRTAQGRQQAEADAAQRERMRRALQRTRPQAPSRTAATPAERARRLANDAALQRVRDEPGNLLREKFLLEYERRHGRDAP